MNILLYAITKHLNVTSKIAREMTKPQQLHL